MMDVCHRSVSFSLFFLLWLCVFFFFDDDDVMRYTLLETPLYLIIKRPESVCQFFCVLSVRPNKPFPTVCVAKTKPF